MKNPSFKFVEKYCRSEMGNATPVAIIWTTFPGAVLFKSFADQVDFIYG